MSASRVAAIVLRQYYLVRGSAARIVPLFAWVAVDIVLWGFITRYLNSVTASGFNFVPVLLGAVLLWDFFSRVMHGVTMAFFEDVWSRNFRSLDVRRSVRQRAWCRRVGRGLQRDHPNADHCGDGRRCRRG